MGFRNLYSHVQGTYHELAHVPIVYIAGSGRKHELIVMFTQHKELCSLVPMWTGNATEKGYVIFPCELIM